MVFAVLGGQVGDGGGDAGAEQLLPLVQVALVDLVEELMVSAGVDERERGRLKEREGEKRKHIKCAKAPA